MLYTLPIFFGLAPSIIWLLFYLRKDHHPEPNSMVLKIFFYGMMIAVIAALVGLGAEGAFFIIFHKNIEIFSFLSFLLFNFLGIALVEEYLKYLVVKEAVLKDPNFDEPVDALLYMIISALGFAALENILYLLPLPGQNQPIFLETLTISAIRFIGATLLHALCAGTIGYFLAFSLFETKKRKGLIAAGIALAAFLHGLYNLSIIGIERTGHSQLILIPVIILITLAFFVSYGFRKMTKIASICKTR